MANGYRPTYTAAPGRPRSLGKPIGSIAPNGLRLPGKMFSIDTSRALALVTQAKGEAARMKVALVEANTELAREFQYAEAKALREAVRGHGRPQRHAQGAQEFNGRMTMDAALKDERNRHVTAAGFTVNDEEFLDGAVSYWRQLEHGWEGRTTDFRGAFSDPAGRSAGGRFTSKSTLGALSPPIPGARSAFRLVQFSRGGYRIHAAVGPRQPYRYIAVSSRETRAYWTHTNRAVNVYRRAFLRNDMPLLAKSMGSVRRPKMGFSNFAE